MSTRRGSKRQATPTPNSTPATGIDHMVVMRESAEYDKVLMEGMIQQTLAKVSHLPGSAELARAGTDVFEHPKRWGATLSRVGKSRMAITERDGVLYVYSMGSAAKTDLHDTNSFVSELANLISTYQPKEVWAVAFTRLLRSADFVGVLLKVFSEQVSILHCEAEIHVATPEGRMLFQVLGMISATERDYMVRRHTAGRVAQWRRNDWIPNAFPPGYRLEDNKLLLDEAAIDATRQMLAILADLSLSTTRCAEEIGRLGVTTPKLVSLHGPDATLNDARNPTEVIATLVGWVDEYESGHHEVLWPSPFPGVTDIAGVAIDEVSDKEHFPHGVISLPQPMPMPDGDWADAATFAAIRTRSKLKSPTGGASHDRTSPLAGMFRFDDGIFEHAMLSPAGGYEFVRRPTDPQRRFDGWGSDADVDVESVARVNRVDLHGSIAATVIDAIASGLPTALDANRFQPIGNLPRLDPHRAKIRSTRRQLDEANDNLRRALRNAKLTDDDESAAYFINDVKHFDAEVRRLEAELTTLATEVDEPELDITFETNAALVAHAIAALANASDSETAKLRDALRTVISDESWTVIDGELRWRLTIDLPHEQGTVALGPIEGRVPVKPSRAPQGQGRLRVRKKAREGLTEIGLPEAASRSIAACPAVELATAIVASVRGSGLPAGLDDEWATHVTSVYSDPDFHWNAGQWRLPDNVRQPALDVLRQAGGSLDRAGMVQAGITSSQLRHLTRDTNAPSGQPIIEVSGRGDSAVYRLITCPHCGGHADHSIVTPETRPGVLCSTCWRAPVLDSPVFPGFYRSRLG